jgi:predicted dehydrogenase
MSSLKIGIVGAGRLGTYHARCLKSIPDAELIGIHDQDISRAQSLAQETGSQSFAQYSQLIMEVDAIIVVTDTQSHYDLSMEAVQRGRHLFVEKPITATTEQGTELVKAARSLGLKLQVGHVERYNRAFRGLGNRALAPRFIESHRLSQFNPRGTDVAVILDLMIHDLDMILHLVNARVEAVEASGVAIVSDTIDIANARLTFTNGCVANVTASRISRTKMRKMRVFSTDSYISMDFLVGKTDIFRLADPKEAAISPQTLPLGEIEKGQRKLKILFESPEIPEANAIELELRDFVNSVLHDLPETIPGEQGLSALELATRIIDAIDVQSRKFPANR